MADDVHLKDSGSAEVSGTGSDEPTEKERDEAEAAREFVAAGYEVLLRRKPEPAVFDRIVPRLADGSVSYSNYLRSLGRSEEFGAKWQAMSPALRRDQKKFIDQLKLRVPDELAVTAITPRRVLIIGSCLSDNMRQHMRQAPISCESDLYFVASELPELPERPIGEYDFQLVQLALRHILPDAWFARLGHEEEAEHEELFSRAVQAMRRHFVMAMRWNHDHGLLTFVFPFIEPMQNPVGRLLPCFDLRNPVRFIQRLNEALYQETANYSNAYMLDLNGILSFYGRRFSQDDLITGFNHGSFIDNFDSEYDVNRLEPSGRALDLFETQVGEAFLAIWRELVGLYRTVRQVDQVKLVVVDLDDTMWRGIVAELDLENLPTSNGWPVGFWEALLILKRRGILLAILSKNEESRVVDVWEKVFRRKLLIEDFVIRKINWNPKAENMAEILTYVNLLPENVLYIDDNPAERAAIKAAFPQIRTLGGSPLLWRRILLWSPETQVAIITGESAARTDMVRAQVTREEHRRAVSREEFLSSLNVSMMLFEINSVDNRRFPRVLELVNKSNQFNTTGRRWSREECLAYFSRGATIFAFEVADQYTSYGLVGVLFVDGPNISQFVMSCRVLGLGVEAAAVALVGEIIIRRGAAVVFGAMIETDRNQPCRALYSQCGFESADGGWRRGAESWLALPSHVATEVELSTSARLATA